MTGAVTSAVTGAVPDASTGDAPRLAGPVLVAGIGNILLGDDGVGVSVAQRLAGRSLPEGVEVVDVGIRGIHLAFQLLDGYSALVMVDAMQRGGSPGDVYVVEPDLTGPPASDAAEAAAAGLMDAHDASPDTVLALMAPLGIQLSRVLVVGVEPADVSARMGLSSAVEAAVDRAADVAVEVAGDLARGRHTVSPMAGDPVRGGGK